MEYYIKQLGTSIEIPDGWNVVTLAREIIQEGDRVLIYRDFRLAELVFVAAVRGEIGDYVGRYNCIIRKIETPE